MTKPQRQLRLIQAVCFVVLGACIVLTYWHAHESAETFSTLGFVQVIIIVLALWSAASGFTMQRKLRRRTQASGKSTPFTRWRAGHIFRLWSATAVGMWAFLFYDFHGPLWVANALFGFATLLLLIWQPDNAPTNEAMPA